MMRRDGVRRVLAVIVLVASWVPALASVVIAWVFQLPEPPVPGAFLSYSSAEVQSRFDDIGVVVAILYGALSALLIARRPHPVVIILVVHALGSAVAAFGVQWGLLAQRYPGLPLEGLLTHAAGWGYIPGTVATTIVPLIVLRGRPGVGARVLIGLGIALAVAAFIPALVHQAPGAPPNPFAIPDAAIQAELPFLYNAAVSLALVVSFVVLVLLAVRWSRTPAADRRPLGWLLLGHVFLTVSYTSLVVPGEWMPSWLWNFGMIAPVAGQIFYPAAVLVLVLGPRLRGIDIAVSRVLVWAIMIAIAVTAYLGLGRVLAVLTGLPIATAGIVAAAVVVLGLLPVRGLVQRQVDLLVWPDGADPAQLVRRLGERIGELESGAEGLEQLAAALRSALRLGWVEIRSVDAAIPPATAGVRGAHELALELRAGDHLVGRLVATGGRDERIPARTRRELEELAGLVAVALRLAQAGASLERARDSVLAVRQSERRALRRELHDGIGPALAGIGFGLAAADNLVTQDPAAARELVARLSDDLGERLDDVRALARAMRDGATHFDLGADLDALARDFSAAGPTITVDAADAARVPVELRRTLYLIAAEALHNAVRHARAGSIRVSVSVPEEVELAIVDDGCGGVTEGASGVGLATMRERAAEAGAWFDLQSPPGRGTAVRVRVPSAPAATDTLAPRPQELTA